MVAAGTIRVNYKCANPTFWFDHTDPESQIKTLHLPRL